jgi:hypothetical protein
MPSSNPTGYETYIYDHKQYPMGDHESRQHLGKLHDVSKLPPPESDYDTGPLIMVEPSYASGSTDVFLHFREGKSFFLPRSIAEQLRDALAKVCEKK